MNKRVRSKTHLFNNSEKNIASKFDVCMLKNPGKSGVSALAFALYGKEMPKTSVCTLFYALVDSEDYDSQDSQQVGELLDWLVSIR